MPTRIEWAEETWNPVTGCTKISPGCANCYAERMARRLRGRCGYPAESPFAVMLHRDRLSAPFRWRKPRLVFVCSMGDLFHKDVPFGFIESAWFTMLANPRHTFLVLTKRPERAREFFRTKWVADSPLDNVWLGVSVENSLEAAERIPELLTTPAALHFVSFEPLLEAIDFAFWPDEHHYCSCGAVTPVDCCDVIGADPGHLFCPCNHEERANMRRIRWVIAGAETGPGARPAKLDWFRSLRDQCAEAGVPFFLKQVNAKRDRELDGVLHEQWPARKEANDGAR